MRIEISTATFDGDCEAGDALTQDVAGFITQRIFPGSFAAVKYDASQCQWSLVAADGDNDDSDAGVGGR